MTFCSKCSKELLSADADVCTHCGKLVKESTQKRKEDKIWYLLPIFLGLIGGIVSYIILKEDVPKLAKNCLILGSIMTIVSIIMYVILTFAMMSMMYGF